MFNGDAAGASDYDPIVKKWMVDNKKYVDGLTK
jgi:hypothetical protein